MEITKGLIYGAVKCVVYGPEGIGKSTFASRFPDPVFIDTEGSTKFLNVSRTPAPKSWAMLMEQVQYFLSRPDTCKTLVIDTADWAEQLCLNKICAEKKIGGIEDLGYGKGYIYLEEEFGRLLNRLSDLVAQGVNVVLTAHAQMRKFEQPDELGAYDRWELKLEKKTAALVKEWADMLLFANYKTYVVNVDNQGAQKGRNKAQGGKRVMYTTHHPCWDAKNRHGLPDELPFDYGEIAPYLEAPSSELPATADTEPPADILKVEPSAPSEPPEKPVSASNETTGPAIPEGIPPALADLMRENNVTEENIRLAVASRGYYPQDMPISKYDPDFISGVLIAAWPQVYEMIKDIDDVPF